MSIIDTIKGYVWAKPDGAHALTVSPYPGNTWRQVAPATTPGAYNYVYTSAGLYDNMIAGDGYLVRQPLRSLQGAGLINGIDSWQAPRGSVGGQIVKQPLYG